MEDKDLEKLSNELFGAFDPGDEAWLVGGSKTITGGPTYSPSGPDAWADLDNWYVEEKASS